jgi:hypothetical protein
MPPQLKQYLNRSILVSIPVLYEDGKCRAYTLRGFGTDGLWLNSEALVHRLLHENDKSNVAGNPIVFVPYTQIAGIVFATVTSATPTQPTIADETPAAANSPSPPAAALAKAEPSRPPVPVEVPAAANTPSPPTATAKVEPPTPPPAPIETPAAVNNAAQPAAATTKVKPPTKRGKSTR